ncbi:hypothetical protein [Aeromicrobium duanguangcaii]|uniref:DUF732 domain-containing protein n=1 Tax=Aeromicrobium duanguangcaii TaxID=2968086 RepID=A0ABY5KKD3_9ACTN|nr:hypothetical protein [Aeromicrobium duanguangcaii]MCD9153434.1 hypothetical protein [Aeromicrobium duanguangcaii]UUI69475.1 hypothetical protein NP095_05080 [Aeromicrobium duanguangcaii]
MGKRKVVFAAILLGSTYGCSAESEPAQERATQSAARTVAYPTDAQQAVLADEVQAVVPRIEVEPDRVAEAMRSTCVAMLDDVPNVERMAATYLTGGLKTDLSEPKITELMKIARAQEWCER